MPKTRIQKEKIIDDLVEKFKKYKSIIFIDYKGLKVKEADEIKRLCKKQDAEYLVCKKTLIKLALDKSGLKDIDARSMQGNIGLIIGFEDEIAPAKIAGDFAKNHEALKMLGGIMEDKFIDLDKVVTLSKISGKKELLAKLVYSINAPVSGFVNVLAANIRGLLTVLNGIKDQKV
ncbi:MAG: 50S ribosomal protein L10 [Candidatus Buchananbacteria bacterium RBG_13_39_9]|uniref:Large ribosomal subunit protein uL10 n=1 Tax=Candidatus Buchananbacteria bacterium RBG_13_39_9 TaxID=1797531 RepID=A0A1G1XUC7_9BACT|nr:MAG: 50S ribosomal protein L10 [Candidatus Buchananbacteria bacterium RBG_13_39_9]